MTSDPGPAPEAAPAPMQAPPRDLGAWLRDMPRWKKVAVFTAVTAMVVGGVLGMLDGNQPAAVDPPIGGGTSGLRTNLLDGASSPAGQSAEEPAAKGVFRLGFSFVAGFCIGAFLRATLRVAAIAFGFWLFSTMALSHYGVLTVDWTAIESLWQRFAGNVEQEWSSFQRFITGSLPSAGLAITGLAIGLKRP